MEKVFTYLDENRKRFLDELMELIKVPSVSSDKAYSKECVKCARMLEKEMKRIGLENVRQIDAKDSPLVYGEWLKAPGKPTVLIYGHYDVMPAKKEDGWDHEPFEPFVDGGYIHGRGASDDKGQLYTYVKAIEAHLAINKKLPVNVKVILEGGEESTSVGFSEFLENPKNRDLLKSDVVAVSDGEWFRKDIPAVETGLRGIAYFELRITGPKTDLHSGLYGGAVANPLSVLTRILGQIQNEDGKINIPGFYDDVVELKESERKDFEKLKFDEKAFLERAGVRGSWGDRKYTMLERLWARPTFEVHGLWGGYTGEGSKTLIPTGGGAKVSMRLVSNQDPEKVAKLFEGYVKKLCPPTVDLEVKVLGKGYPVLVDGDNVYIKKARKVYEETFKKESAFMRSGGSIPVIALLSRYLSVPIALLNLGHPDAHSHGPNEKFPVEQFEKGTKFVARVLEEWSEAK